MPILSGAGVFSLPIDPEQEDHNAGLFGPAPWFLEYILGVLPFGDFPLRQEISPDLSEIVTG